MCHVFSPSRAVLSYDMLWIFEAFHETCRQASMLSGAEETELASEASRAWPGREQNGGGACTLCF